MVPKGVDDVIWERLIPGGGRQTAAHYGTYRRVGQGRRTAFRRSMAGFGAGGGTVAFESWLLL
jgi:hypothetical protein